jgi:hypothetical protein
MDYAKLPRANFLDERVIEQWRQLRLAPSPPADDATFLRRSYLDLTGTLPAPEAVRAFLHDPDPKKRAALIDRLLDSPEFVDAWTQKWSDIFRVSREWIGEKSMWTFHHYLRDRIRRNVPWDEVVRELVAGCGDSGHVGPPNFYRLQKVFNEAELWPLVAAETTAQTFLGIRLQCARCHNHPLDRWTQADYYGLANCFARVEARPGPDGSVVIFDRRAGGINHPRLGRPLPPKVPGGATLPAGSRLDPREYLARWITAADNPYFARATANRVWRHFLGVGLIEPVDDFRASNVPSNGPLLDALAAELTKSHFDIKQLIRLIATSRVYQLSSEATPDNRADTRFYSHYYPRRMTAEQLLDALGAVTGRPVKFPGLAANLRAQQLPDTRVASTFLDAFGRPLRRTASCECERVQEANLGQALELMNGPLLSERVHAEDGLVQRLLEKGIRDESLVEEIYVRCLSRPPRPGEKEAIRREWEKFAGSAHDHKNERRAFYEEVLWALLNSKEFLFNH